MAWGGWSDAGESASHAAQYLTMVLEGEQFATIDAEEYYDFTKSRPLASYQHGQRQIVWPGTDFYAIHTPDRSHDLVVGMGQEPHFHWKRYLAAMRALTDAANIRSAISLGAVSAPVPHTRPVHVRGSANNPALAERFDMHPSHFEGPSGMVGVFHDDCRRREIDGISLWASVPHYLAGIINPMGARALLEKLAEIDELTIPYEQLEREERRFERRVRLAVEQNENLAAYIKQIDENLAENPDEDGSEADFNLGLRGQGELPPADTLITDLEKFLRNRRQQQ